MENLSAFSDCSHLGPAVLPISISKENFQLSSLSVGFYKQAAVPSWDIWIPW